MKKFGLLPIKNTNHFVATGFTLIELLVVIVIIGILATIGIASFSNYQTQAKRAHSLAEMAQIMKAIKLMEIDTELSVGGLALGTCVAGPEYTLNANTGAGGLLKETSTGGIAYSFAGGNWNGPYAEEHLLKDPWGQYYVFDWDIVCGPNDAPPEKCNGYTGVISGLRGRGPDGVGDYVDDDIIPYCIPSS